MIESEEQDTDKSKQEPLEAGRLKKTLSNAEILSQAILFLTVGAETTANTLAFLSHSLAMHPEYQEKLIEEVDSVLERFNGEVTYESVNEMPYMEQCIDETLRMYPPAIRVNRVCNKDYEYNGIKIAKDQIWTVSIWAVHRDPELYPEPEKFDPERFNEQNKKARENEAFIPFGTGPRNCIGARFAVLEVKLLLALLLKKYKFEKCEQTVVINLFFDCLDC